MACPQYRAAYLGPGDRRRHSEGSSLGVFAGALRFSSTSLIGNPNLVTKIYMPREIFPLASILSQLLIWVLLPLSWGSYF